MGDVVYLIHAPEVRRLKIGVAASAEWRLRGLQTGSPVALHLVATLTGGYELEKHLHDRYADRAVMGEWFEDSVLAEILAEYDADRCLVVANAGRLRDLRSRRDAAHRRAKSVFAELSQFTDEAVASYRDSYSRALDANLIELLTILEELSACGESDPEVLSWVAEARGLLESFQTEIAISGENGGGGNRTRVTCPTDSSLSRDSALAPADDDPRIASRLASVGGTDGTVNG